MKKKMLLKTTVRKHLLSSAFCFRHVGFEEDFSITMSGIGHNPSVNPMYSTPQPYEFERSLTNALVLMWTTTFFEASQMNYFNSNQNRNRHFGLGGGGGANSLLFNGATLISTSPGLKLKRVHSKFPYVKQMQDDVWWSNWPYLDSLLTVSLGMATWVCLDDELQMVWFLQPRVGNSTSSLIA